MAPSGRKESDLTGAVKYIDTYVPYPSVELYTSGAIDANEYKALVNAINSANPTEILDLLTQISCHIPTNTTQLGRIKIRSEIYQIKCACLSRIAKDYYDACVNVNRAIQAIIDMGAVDIGFDTMKQTFVTTRTQLYLGAADKARNWLTLKNLGRFENNMFIFNENPFTKAYCIDMPEIFAPVCNLTNALLQLPHTIPPELL